MLKNKLKNIIISIITDIIGVSSGIIAIYSVVNEQYIITCGCLLIMGYLAYLEGYGKIQVW